MTQKVTRKAGILPCCSIAKMHLAQHKTISFYAWPIHASSSLCYANQRNNQFMLSNALTTPYTFQNRSCQTSLASWLIQQLHEQNFPCSSANECIDSSTSTQACMHASEQASAHARKQPSNTWQAKCLKAGKTPAIAPKPKLCGKHIYDWACAPQCRHHKKDAIMLRRRSLPNTL